MLDKDNSAEFLALKMRPPTLEQSNFLRKIFGLEKVKPLQWRVISSVMAAKRDQVHILLNISYQKIRQPILNIARWW